ncbi:F0F1 ATP synthase subunit alpha [Candidatus Nesciobacter abundans]|uniref:ATP synthase subunit alpha n=1 Tax=Candidatus Nesciobacter abundans TaxID=2601668 RepID=A0A5C0UFR7_9PROT|nr:F0F1 ATP synthase subunit alpha [Candidatus Nesciobacter abundans]QEK38946.1 F0F1 ATP synthase subunit alpha [Candidatus Nesciobacter abundans]
MNKLNIESLVEEIESKIKNSKEAENIKSEEIGYVEEISDGIAIVSGLNNAVYGDLVKFSNNQKGWIVELLENYIKCVVLDSDPKVKVGMTLKSEEMPISTMVGKALLGRVVNALGEPLDGKGVIKSEFHRNVMSEAPGIMDRKNVNEPLYTGIKAIDTLIPIGLGQRELILGDRTTGKTSIAIDTILNQKRRHEEGNTIYCVYVCIGKKMSEVAKMVSYLESQGAMEYTTFVVASAADAGMLQYLAPYVGCSIGEYYRDNGENSLIVYDDLSKHAIAHRQMSLLLRRFPGREAYPGDVFFVHANLLERAACMSDENGGGSLTALPIIETLAGNISSYISTNVISITDGQIFLDKNLFLSGQRPAINTGVSVSRVGSSAQTKAMTKVAGMMKLELSQYAELKEFSRYLTDIDESTSRILNRGDAVTRILRQDLHELLTFEEEIIVIFGCNLGCFDKYDDKTIKKMEKKFLEVFWSKHPEVVSELKENKVITEDMSKKIKDFATYFRENF